MAARGICAREVEEVLANKTTSPDPEVRERSFRKHYQKTFTTELNLKLRYNPEAYMRSRLERYEFNLFPRIAAEEAMATLEVLSTQAMPRVCAAVSSTYWDRWMT